MERAMTFPDIIGLAGTTGVVVAYGLLQTGVLKPESLIYSGVNAFASGLLLVSLFFDFNLASLVLQIVWILISLYGMAKTLRARSRAS
jgi:hypothetical protein